MTGFEEEELATGGGLDKGEVIGARPELVQCLGDLPRGDWLLVSGESWRETIGRIHPVAAEQEHLPGCRLSSGRVSRCNARSKVAIPASTVSGRKPRSLSSSSCARLESSANQSFSFLATASL